MAIQNDALLQDWTAENKAALLAFVHSVHGMPEAVDIHAVGSRLYRLPSGEETDVDIVVFFPEPWAAIGNTFHEYEGVRVSIFYLPISKRYQPFIDQYDVPYLSLMDGTYHAGNAEDIAAVRALLRKPE